MFGVGTQELVIILLVVLVLFGGKGIPEVARSLGTGLQGFRRAVRDAQREIDRELLSESPRPAKPGPPPPDRPVIDGGRDRPAAEPARAPDAGGGTARDA